MFKARKILNTKFETDILLYDTLREYVKVFDGLEKELLRRNDLDQKRLDKPSKRQRIKKLERDLHIAKGALILTEHKVADVNRAKGVIEKELQAYKEKLGVVEQERYNLIKENERLSAQVPRYDIK